jgi:mono/diheme cytochrome c family protein
MMKIRLFILPALIGVMAVSCGFDKRDTGKVYMPDMAYSRAYETYAARDTSKFTTDPNDWHVGSPKIFYNNLPVEGTVSRSADYIFPLAADKQGDTANYFASRLVSSPVKSLTEDELKESERLYLINCGICHGDKLDGNGPLWKDGNGPFPAAPKNLKTLAMSDGTMFYSITYGRNLMGSYASQLTPKQRWDIIYYIRTKQGNATAPAAETTDSGATAKN